MKIGYPRINRTLSCRGNKAFRLKSYSPERLIGTVHNNLSCLLDILQFNVTRNLLFFRITSDLIPSHQKATGNRKRRPPRSQRKHSRSSPSQTQLPAPISYPIWRCRVCGYLCERNNPPERCPICKAQKDR